MRNILFNQSLDIYYTYLDDLTNEEINALRRYSTNDYSLINLKLRNILKYRIGSVEHSIKLIDSALDKFILLKPIKVYRKIYIYGDLEEYLKMIEKDKFILDKAYQSTSLRIDGFSLVHNVLLEIDINNPYVGALISPYSINKLESEFLIKRDTLIDINDLSYEKDKHLIKVKGMIK